MDDGQTLLPSLIDEIACSDPERFYCGIVKSPNVSDGIIKVSYSKFANAVNSFAWWLDEQLGKSVDFATVAYVGPTDIRYALATLAAVKTGRKY